MAGIGFRAPPFVTGQMILDAERHFASVWPEEGVGFLLATGFKPVANIAENKETHFAIAPAEWLLAEGPILAILHSHPRTDPVPSEADMRSQIDSNVPWGVMQSSAEGCSDPTWFGDQLEPLPLLGRPFVHGVADCFALVRDYFRQTHGIILPDQPRDQDWFKKGQDFYAFYRDWGFSPVETESDFANIRPGDCFLMKLRSPVLNHAGIYTGDGLILHHLEGYLSHHVPLHTWASHVALWVRHASLQVPEEG